MTTENATLVERIELAPTLVIFRIRPDVVPPVGDPWFQPGQYAAIGVGDVQRAYSIASEPAERRWLEFYVRFAREPATVSPLTHRLFKVPVGGRLHVGEKIAGRFTLERTVPPGDDRKRLLVAAGTGLAPFVSMVRHARRAGGEASLAHLAILHGVSHPHELAYRDELGEAAAHFGLLYLPTVSRPAGYPDWAGLTGRVETLFDGGGLAGLALSPEKTTVYVCGFRDTIAGSVRRLLRRGYVPDDRRLRRLIGIKDEAKPTLFFEQYDLEPIFDPKDQALVAELRDAVK